MFNKNKSQKAESSGDYSPIIQIQDPLVVNHITISNNDAYESKLQQRDLEIITQKDILRKKDEEIERLKKEKEALQAIYGAREDELSNGIKQLLKDGNYIEASNLQQQAIKRFETESTHKEASMLRKKAQVLELEYQVDQAKIELESETEDLEEHQLNIVEEKFNYIRIVALYDRCKAISLLDDLLKDDAVNFFSYFTIAEYKAFLYSISEKNKAIEVLQHIILKYELKILDIKNNKATIKAKLYSNTKVVTSEIDTATKKPTLSSDIFKTDNHDLSKNTFDSIDIEATKEKFKFALYVNSQCYARLLSLYADTGNINAIIKNRNKFVVFSAGMQDGEPETTLGYIFFKLGMIDSAIKFFEKDIDKVKDTYGIFTRYNLLFKCYVSQGNSEKMEYYFRKLSKVFTKELDNPFNNSLKAIFLEIESQYYLYKQDYKKAIEKVEEAVSLCQQESIRYELSMCYITLSELYFAKNKMELAYQSINNAIDIAQKYGYESIEGTAWFNKASRTDKVKEKIIFLKKALLIYKNIYKFGYFFLSLVKLAHSYLQLGKGKTAQAYMYNSYRFFILNKGNLSLDAESLYDVMVAFKQQDAAHYYRMIRVAHQTKSHFKIGDAYMRLVEYVAEHNSSLFKDKLIYKVLKKAQVYFQKCDEIKPIHLQSNYSLMIQWSILNKNKENFDVYIELYKKLKPDNRSTLFVTLYDSLFVLNNNQKHATRSKVVKNTLETLLKHQDDLNGEDYSFICKRFHDDFLRYDGKAYWQFLHKFLQKEMPVDEDNLGVYLSVINVRIPVFELSNYFYKKGNNALSLMFYFKNISNFWFVCDKKNSSVNGFIDCFSEEAFVANEKIMRQIDISSADKSVLQIYIEYLLAQQNLAYALMKTANLEKALWVLEDLYQQHHYILSLGRRYQYNLYILRDISDALTEIYTKKNNYLKSIQYARKKQYFNQQIVQKKPALFSINIDDFID